MITKICCRCHRELPLDGFSRNKQKRDGLNTSCKDCHHKYYVKWYQRNKQEHKKAVAKRKRKIKQENRQRLWQYLLQHPCVDCGNDNLKVLEFDHIDSTTKDGSISSMLSSGRSWEIIEQEIGKCEVRCANCHRIKTSDQLGWWKSVNGAVTQLAE